MAQGTLEDFARWLGFRDTDEYLMKCGSDYEAVEQTLESMFGGSP